MLTKGHEIGADIFYFFVWFFFFCSEKNKACMFHMKSQMNFLQK